MMIKTMATTAAALLMALPVVARDEVATSSVTEVAAPAAKVELAICLDTSGSMEQLIDAARQKLWTIVNDLALAEPTPELKVALLTFGNDGHSAESGWVKIESELTNDLDMISKHLFRQTTNGGTELVGRVIQAATQQLKWSENPGDLKLLFVAGNESADQDQEVSFRDACKAAIECGIQVNSIYCGNPDDELAPVWREVAMRADGHFAAIDHENGTLVIESPFDEELVKLNERLNATYLPWGEMGLEGCQNQVEQDANAEGLNGAAIAGRAAWKSNKLYYNSWDLVDAMGKKDVKLEDLKAEDLPEKMREMTPAQRVAHVEEMKAKRAEVQKEIKGVDSERQKWLVVEKRRLELDDEDSFDNAVRTAIRSQATTKGLRFPEPVRPVVEESKPEEAAETTAVDDTAEVEEAGETTVEAVRPPPVGSGTLGTGGRGAAGGRNSAQQRQRDGLQQTRGG